MRYKCLEKIEITKEQFDNLQKLFDIDFEDIDENGDYVQQDLIDELGAYRDDTYCSFQWEFEDGKSITYEICSGNSNYYDNAVLWKKDKENGCYYQEDYFDCDYSIAKTMEFEYNDDTYICEFEIKGE